MDDEAWVQAGGVPLGELLRRGALFSEACPSREVLKNVTSRWGVLVLVGLKGESPLRFSALRRKIQGVSERMLAQTLQRLEEDGFISRHALPVVPPHVEYSLTPLGCEVADCVEQLADWIELNIHRILAARKARAAS